MTQIPKQLQRVREGGEILKMAANDTQSVTSVNYT